MEAVGGRPGDGDEIEAVLRRYFGSLREPVADVTVGKLHEAAVLFDAEVDKLPWGLVTSESRVKRVGTVRVDGDEAAADFSATRAPTLGPAGIVPKEEVVSYEGPMKLVRDEGRWKLADFYVDGVLASAGIAAVHGSRARHGITVELLLARVRGKSAVLHLRLRNDRDRAVCFLDAGAFRLAGFRAGAASRFVTVEPGTDETAAFSWVGRVRPFTARVNLVVPVFDLGRRRWLSVLVRGQVQREGAG